MPISMPAKVWLMRCSGLFKHELIAALLLLGFIYYRAFIWDYHESLSHPHKWHALPLLLLLLGFEKEMYYLPDPGSLLGVGVILTPCCVCSYPD